MSPASSHKPSRMSFREKPYRYRGAITSTGQHEVGCVVFDAPRRLINKNFSYYTAIFMQIIH